MGSRCPLFSQVVQGLGCWWQERERVGLDGPVNGNDAGRPFCRHDNHPFACRRGICRPYVYRGPGTRLYLYLFPGHGVCPCLGHRRILTWEAFGMTFWSAKVT